MTTKEIIAQLEELILDREAFIDKDEPDSVYEKDIEALRYAADFLQTHPRDGAASYFFTFGTDPQFPFGINEFVEVHADNPNQAAAKFKGYYPNRSGGNVLNCSSVYGEEKWKEIYKEYYNGRKPSRVID